MCSRGEHVLLLRLCCIVCALFVLAAASIEAYAASALTDKWAQYAPLILMGVHIVFLFVGEHLAVKNMHLTGAPTAFKFFKITSLISTLTIIGLIVTVVNFLIPTPFLTASALKILSIAISVCLFLQAIFSILIFFIAIFRLH
jgi:hypothetical protein